MSRQDTANKSGTVNSLNFAVHDTGIGIPKNKIDHVFEEFTQADSSTTRKYGGTGLGLSISNLLSQLMGGRLKAESKLNSGSTFSLLLGLPDVEPPAVENLSVQGSLLLSTANIMVVGDVTGDYIITQRWCSYWTPKDTRATYK